jgi:peptidoglycan/xylan/chitin deacetylase (PgdA/CDA1 family)
MSLKSNLYWFFGCKCLPLMRLLGKSTQAPLSIIMMHGVHNTTMAASGPPPSSSVLMDDLQTNLRALARLYTVISMDEAIEMLAGRTVRRKPCIVLTFDDSLKCLVDIVAPWLAKLGLTATFYVSTEVIDSQKPYWWLRLEYAVARAKRSRTQVELPLGRLLLLEAGRARDTVQEIKAILREANAQECEQVIESIEAGLGASLLDEHAAYPYGDVMSWEDVCELRSLGMTIGSHTVTHPNLTLLAPVELRRELEQSRRRIEAACQTPCRHLCYPYGAYSAAVAEAARACGYISAVTTVSPGWNDRQTDVFHLRRFAMPRQAYKLPYLISGFDKIVKQVRSLYDVSEPLIVTGFLMERVCQQVRSLYDVSEPLIGG